MSQFSTGNTVELFKKVYGSMHDLTDKRFLLAREIPWQQGAMVGDSFIEAFVLSAEVGITFGGSDQGAVVINEAIPGAVKQSSIKPYQTIMNSLLPWNFMSRAASGNDEKAFYNSTKYVMQNHIRSHSRFKEIARLFGQSSAKLGYISYAPSGTVYRGATYTGSGTITLTKADGTTIAFTNGVNAASKAILLAPGMYAAGIWTGMTDVVVKQLDSTGAISAQGKLIGNDADLGILYVNFTPVAPTAITGAGSQRLCFDGWEDDLEMIGIRKILQNTGTLFNIDAAKYELWAANVMNVNNKRLSLKAIQVGVMMAVNKGGLEDPLDILVSPRVFAYMINDEAALRRYGAEYKSTAQNGFEAIEFYSANGVNRIRPYRYVMEGEAYGLKFDDWVRSGSAEVSFNIPGMDQEVIFPLENQTGYAVRSYSDEYIVCRAPCHQVYWSNIDSESVAF